MATDQTHYELVLRRHSLAEPWTYGLLDQAQRELQARLCAQDKIRGAVFVSELAPVITLGRRECSQDLLVSPELLKKHGIELYPTDRGGRATYHGPGQWVVFVVDRLERLTGDPRGVRRAVEGLLELGRDLGLGAGLQGVEIRDGNETGVWTRRGKLASVGVHIQKGILLHGLAINGFRTPESFFGLRPCGLDAQVDFLFGPDAHGQSQFSELPQAILRGLEQRFWLSR
ncbi:MAG: lipoyl protein ligase domain-containing protein [Oligoflexia bacterium]|jgi:lipoyl(octanoyl) transferase